MTSWSRWARLAVCWWMNGWKKSVLYTPAYFLCTFTSMLYLEVWFSLCLSHGFPQQWKKVFQRLQLSLWHESWMLGNVFHCVCVGLSDKEDWLGLNDRELANPPGVKPVLNLTPAKAPAPVPGPHVGPAAESDAGANPVLEPRGPNIPILAKPPTKVRVVFAFPFTLSESSVLTKKHIVTMPSVDCLLNKTKPN